MLRQGDEQKCFILLKKLLAYYPLTPKPSDGHTALKDIPQWAWRCCM